MVKSKKNGKKCVVSNCGSCGRYIKLEKSVGKRTHYCDTYCFTGVEFRTPPSFCKMGVMV